MEISAADFTPNDVIDNIQIGDNTVDIIGYVTKSNNNLMSPKKSKFQKFVINTAQGREVQVTAWNDNVPLLKCMTEMGMIVYVGSVKATAIKNKNYNNGNVNFELLVKENSTIEVCGSYTSNDNINNILEEVSICESYTKIGKRIKIEGIVKNEFRKFINQDINYFIAAITDCEHKLEVKADCDTSTFDFQKGNSVTIIGTVESYPPGPVMLRLDNIKDINKIDRERVQFIDLYQGFRNRVQHN